MLDGGKDLARTGEVGPATSKFQQALNLDPNLPFGDPAAEAQRLAQHTAANLVEEGLELAERGDIEAALAKFQEAEELDADFEISGGDWHTLCAQGGQWGQAKAVLEACNRAIALAPKKGLFYNSRAIVRLQIGDADGAREDLEFFEEWLKIK